MIEFSVEDVQGIIGYMIGSFSLGWCIGYLIKAYKNFMQKIAS